MENRPESYDERREFLFDSPCRVIDFLPRQVPASAGGNYFAVERYLSGRPRLDALYQKFAHLVLCLTCYVTAAADLASPYSPEYDETAGGNWVDDPAPEELTAMIEACAGDPPPTFSLLFPGEDALLTLNGGDLYMTLYHPSADLLDLVRPLAAAEGLFVREGAE